MAIVQMPMWSKSAVRCGDTANNETEYLNLFTKHRLLQRPFQSTKQYGQLFIRQTGSPELAPSEKIFPQADIAGLMVWCDSSTLCKSSGSHLYSISYVWIRPTSLHYSVDQSRKVWGGNSAPIKGSGIGRFWGRSPGYWQSNCVALHGEYYRVLGITLNGNPTLFFNVSTLIL